MVNLNVVTYTETGQSINQLVIAYPDIEVSAGTVTADNLVEVVLTDTLLRGVVKLVARVTVPH